MIDFTQYQSKTTTHLNSPQTSIRVQAMMVEEYAERLLMLMNGRKG